LFEASDGQVAIAPSNDAVYFKLLDALGIPELREHPDFRSPADRFARRPAINERINQVTRTRPIGHWMQVLNAAGVPCGRVLDLRQVFDDPQVQHQRMRVRIEHPVHGPIDVLGFPIKFSDEPCRIHRLPPELGGDNDAVLSSLGYSPEAIAALRRDRII
jgi:crotonobetainyl-CoA:carnitine CoA-transferase CaiB-like acyl-CoA transferase